MSHPNQFHPPQGNPYPQGPPHYQDVSPYGDNSQSFSQPNVIQQGVVYQAVPNPQVPNFQPPMLPQYAHQVQMIHPQQQAFALEMKIKHEFCCYTVLLYLNIIGGSLNILFAFFGLQPNLFATFLNIVAVSVSLYAVIAKSSLDSKKQYNTFWAFTILTIITLPIVIIIGLMTEKETESEMFKALHEINPYQDRENGQFAQAAASGIMFIYCIAVLVGLAFSLLMIHYARKMYKLMKERELLLNNYSAAENTL